MPNDRKQHERKQRESSKYGEDGNSRRPQPKQRREQNDLRRQVRDLGYSF